VLVGRFVGREVLKEEGVTPLMSSSASVGCFGCECGLWFLLAAFVDFGFIIKIYILKPLTSNVKM